MHIPYSGDITHHNTCGSAARYHNFPTREREPCKRLESHSDPANAFLLTGALGEISCRSLVWVQWYAVEEEVWEEVCAFISVWVYTHLWG